MTTPGNPNRAVLEGMLDSVAEAGGGGSMVIKVDHYDDETFIAYYDKTWNEVNEALAKGNYVTIVEQSSWGGVQQYRVYLAVAGNNKKPWGVYYFAPERTNPIVELAADTADGYLRDVLGE